MDSSEFELYSIRGSLSPRVSLPNSISIGSAVVAQLIRVPNTQTHANHVTCDICRRNRLHLSYAHMWCGLQMDLAEKWSSDWHAIYTRYSYSCCWQDFNRHRASRGLSAI